MVTKTVTDLSRVKHESESFNSKLQGTGFRFLEQMESVANDARKEGKRLLYATACHIATIFPDSAKPEIVILSLIKRKGSFVEQNKEPRFNDNSQRIMLYNFLFGENLERISIREENLEKTLPKNLKDVDIEPFLENLKGAGLILRYTIWSAEIPVVELTILGHAVAEKIEEAKRWKSKKVEPKKLLRQPT
ncbi:MAG: hypothetical protein ABR981_01775 [Candidatus Micrarchaeaceae archaeon]